MGQFGDRGIWPNLVGPDAGRHFIACSEKEKVVSPQFIRAPALIPALCFIAFAVTGFCVSMLSHPAVAGPYYDRDIGRFESRDALIWRGGYWRNGYHHGRFGWWWVVAGQWYYYPEPIYPYPNPYLPPVVIVHDGPPQPSIQGPAPTQFWYYCDKPAGYYPYVPTCPTPWREVAPQAPQAPPAPSGVTPPPPPPKK